MKEILLSEVSKYSPWPARLQGLTPWSTPKRDRKKIEKEYNQDHYAKCLEIFKSGRQTATPRDIFFRKIDLNREVCVSEGEKFYLIGQGKFYEKNEHKIFDVLAQHMKGVNTILDLGCGFGYFLWQLSSRYSNALLAGGEYSMNAVRLARCLFEKNERFQIQHFDFYEKKCYQMISKLKPPILVTTLHAVEQLPSAKVILDCLSDYRSSIHAVVHIEPVCEVYSESVVGLMRRRYVEINDYNRDLLSELKSMKAVEIIQIQKEVLSINPFNPSTVIVWRFC